MGSPYLDGLLTTLVYQTGSLVGKIGGAFGGALRLSANFATSLDPNGDLELDVAANPTLQAVTVTSITLAGQAQPFISGPYTLKTFDNSAHTLATIAIPAAATLDAEIKCIAVLGTGPNANEKPSIYRFSTIGVRVGSGSPTATAEADSSSISAPFVASQGSGSPGPGSPNIVASSNNVLFQVVGFAIKEAWTSGHSYVKGDGNTTPGDFVTSSGGVWLCTTSGTASGSAPTGTGTGQGTGALFDYMGPASGSQVQVSWTMVITGLVGGS